MVIRANRAIPLVLGMVLSAACASAGGPQSSPTPALPIVKTANGLTVSLSYDPVPLKTGVPTRITLNLVDAQNRPVDDATITIRLDMLGMKMEKNEPKVLAMGNGTYTAMATFAMGGNTWVVDLHIVRGGQATNMLFSGLDVRE